MNILHTIQEVMDLRSFSSLWFWIALAVTWSRVSHNVMGLPWDMVTRGRRLGGQAQADVEAQLEISLRRILYIHRTAGVAMVAIVSAILSTLGILGFFQRIELAQALFLILLPLTLVGLLRLRTALRFEADLPAGHALFRRLNRHRMMVQGIGILALLVTSMWGMLQNLTVRVL